MTEPRSGMWWAGDSPVAAVPGTLTRVDDHWQLDLIGTLPVNTYWTDSLSLVPLERIYGACHGVKYTLDGARLTNSRGPVLTQQHLDPELTGDQCWQRWCGTVLIAGDTVPKDALFSSASFEFTGLSTWWPFSGLRGPSAARSIDDYEPPEPLTVDLNDGSTLKLWVRERHVHGLRVRSLEENVTIFFQGGEEFTFDYLIESVIAPLRGLVAISLNSPSHVHSIELTQKVDGNREALQSRTPLVVDPGCAYEDPRELSPLLTAETLDLVNFLPRWMEIARACQVPLSVAEPHDRSEDLTVQVVSMVSAAETLHRILMPDPKKETSALAERVLEVMTEHGKFNSSERRKVASSLSYSEISLERRLQEIANAFGDEGSAWLFDGMMKDWALVSATIRNALSHGYTTHHNVESDPGALVTVLRFTQITIVLRLLIAAGFPHDGDLVRHFSSNRRVLALVRQRMASWPTLAERIRAPR
ncbi:HEPN domain-containing protein [Streptomyces sp. NPDC093225]|uniref:ApeA N-terminal domain 1-containing protein n=1 Tax=Streptomyces sp. NPDC093225 TaxID=3366034 RepID=UPI0037FF450B